MLERWFHEHPVTTLLGAALVLNALFLLAGLYLVGQARTNLCESLKTTQIANYRAALNNPLPDQTPSQVTARRALLVSDIRRVEATSCGTITGS